jgi:hypothetical protein
MLERFLNQPVIVETQAGQVVDVLTRAHMGIHDRWILQVHAFVGMDRWVLIKTWSALKTARSST